ncbi:hypothetical protein [Phormidium sp. CCY1219]|uniref:hypothetical protein n=1 Tax=Phormidium sp. CCY1219 TaxID=2886104 RepID=UPI002D1F21EF|nr:hypothetical protein [Phormidium sp. CCY1219]MEB3828761.1 hypothetical protein [Phormidium sp. CCY1219]
MSRIVEIAPTRSPRHRDRHSDNFAPRRSNTMASVAQGGTSAIAAFNTTSLNAIAEHLADFLPQMLDKIIILC